MNTTTQFTNGVLFELRPRNVIVTRNGANLQYYEVLRIVFRNYTTAFKLIYNFSYVL